MTTSASKVTRSGKHGLLGGVCAGIALNKGWPVSLTRLATLLLICATGFGILLYFLFWLLLPKWDESTQGPEPTALPDDPLVRDPRNKIIAGVCGSIATFFGFDAALVRIVAALFILLGGVGIVPYIYAWIVIPVKKESPV